MLQQELKTGSLDKVDPTPGSQEGNNQVRTVPNDVGGYYSDGYSEWWAHSLNDETLRGFLDEFEIQGEEAEKRALYFRSRLKALREEWKKRELLST
jgi:hypothetical protein